MELELNLLEMYDMVVRWCLGFEVEEADCCATSINSWDEETSGLFLPKTGRTTKRAVSWANKMAGPAAKMEAPNWYTCVGIPVKYNKKIQGASEVIFLPSKLLSLFSKLFPS